MTWYVRTETREFGPLSEQALRAIAATGQIDGRTLVRRSVREEWVSVATVPGILPPAGRVASPPVARAAVPPPEPKPAPKHAPDPPPASAPPELTLALAPDPPSTSAPDSTFVLVPEPRRALSPTPPPTPAPARTLEGLPIPEPGPDIATPWRRFWARWLDVIFGACIVGFVLGTIRPSLYQPGGWGLEHSQLLGWLVTPVVMVLDAVIYAIFGNTLGKMIAGIAVREEHGGGRLAFFVYLKRNFELYFLALGTGFPIIALITLYISFRRVAGDELSSWDLSADSRVIARSVNPVRTWVVAVVYIAMIAVLTQARTFEQHQREQRLAANAGNSRYAEKQLRDAADLVNQRTPRMIDGQTRLDQAEVGAGLVFTYRYTLLNQRSAGLPPENVERFRRQVQQRLHVSICEKHAMDALLRLASAVKYVYRDRDGAEVATVVVTSADCLH
jgi:hypothetical protein